MGEACREKGVSIGDLVDTIEKAQQPPDVSRLPDWSSAPLGQLIDHILSKHHAYLRSEFPRLSRMLAKVTEAHGGTHGESLFPVGKLYERGWRELEDHMWKEENVLFPLIRRMEEAHTASQENTPRVSVSDPIRVMEFEHRSAGNALNQMRRLTNEYETDGCATYQALMEGLKALESDLHQHIHLENNILFPRAIELEY